LKLPFISRVEAMNSSGKDALGTVVFNFGVRVEFLLVDGRYVLEVISEALEA
jgi:hypothetical protein